MARTNQSGSPEAPTKIRSATTMGHLHMIRKGIFRLSTKPTIEEIMEEEFEL
jgi:hypothetical protein